jgi:glycosyltransferase involved in cell wall biosynthesis
VIVATVVKNEAHKYLESALARWQEWGAIVAVDNDSTDGSKKLLERYSSEVLSVKTPLWGDENLVRAELYRLAMERAADREWVLWLDADMTVSADPRLLDHPEVDAVAMRWFDLWGPQLARFDDMWRAHLAHKTWMVRKHPDWRRCSFPDRGIHVGPIPPDYPIERTLLAPETHALIHYGYADHRDRQEKYDRYLSVAELLTPGELAHARSILAREYLLVTPPPNAHPLTRAN